MKSVQAIIFIVFTVLISMSIVEANGDLTVSGTTITKDLALDLDCTANANGGALTTDALGVVGCSDDESGPAEGGVCVAGGVPGKIVTGFDDDGEFFMYCFRGVVTTKVPSFGNPFGVAVNEDGIIYLTAGTNQTILKYEVDDIGPTLLAGSNFVSGYLDGTGAAAKFSGPRDVALDSAGNVYVGDSNNHRIRKITPGGVVTTLAGSGTPGSANGNGVAAEFNGPHGVAVDGDDNVYVADSNNQSIRKITPAGDVTTLAGGSIGYVDGTGAAAKFYYPIGVAVDGVGNVYVGDSNNHRIRKVTQAGVVTTVAGSTQGFADGTGTAAMFSLPFGVDVDDVGNIYVADRANNRIRKITPTGVVTTLAGSGVAGSADGNGIAAEFYSPVGVAVESLGKTIYVADFDTSLIRVINN